MSAALAWADPKPTPDHFDVSLEPRICCDKALIISGDGPVGAAGAGVVGATGCVGVAGAGVCATTGAAGVAGAAD